MRLWSSTLGTLLAACLVAHGAEGGASISGPEPARSTGPVLAQESGDVEPFPIAPLRNRTDPETGRTEESDSGVSPFPLPSDIAPAPDTVPRSSSRDTADRMPAGAEADRRTADEQLNLPRSMEREIGVPPFPYDPEARAASARTCTRGCMTARTECARAGEPVRNCEGAFILCARDCGLGRDPMVSTPFTE